MGVGINVARVEGAKRKVRTGGGGCRCVGRGRNLEACRWVNVVGSDCERGKLSRLGLRVGPKKRSYAEMMQILQLILQKKLKRLKSIIINNNGS